MIRNNVQLARAKARLENLQKELSQLALEYSGSELKAYSIPLQNEIGKHREDIAEYEQLKAKDVREAVFLLQSRSTPIGQVGQLLTKLRIASDLSQEELADKLGWKQPNVSRFENENYSSQTVHNIIEYAGALGVSIQLTPKSRSLSTENWISEVAIAEFTGIEFFVPRSRLDIEHIDKPRATSVNSTAVVLEPQRVGAVRDDSAST